MQTVTSNAVYDAIFNWQRIYTKDDNNFIEGCIMHNRKYIHIRFEGWLSGSISNGYTLYILQSDWRPTKATRARVGIDRNADRIDGGIDINIDGTIKIYFGSGISISDSTTIIGIYADVLTVLN